MQTQNLKIRIVTYISYTAMTMNGWLNYVLFINDVSAAGRIQIKD
jgi:hypothetical protein